MENLKKHPIDASIKKEKCVICFDETPYIKNIPIHERRYYVEGAGQLCERCYDQIYTWKNYTYAWKRH